MKKVFISILIIAAVLVLFSCKNENNGDIDRAFNSFRGKFVIVVEKSKFKLTVYDRNRKAAASYLIGYGLNLDRKAKLYEGDNRTPEGFYRINEILSMDADRNSSSYQKLMKMNRVFFRAAQGHSRYGRDGVDLGDNVYGPRFYGIDYPSDADRVKYNAALERGEIPSKNGRVLPIGSGIAIHGNSDENSIGHLSSSGCIRMFNRDVVSLEKFITISTPVLIYGE